MTPGGCFFRQVSDTVYPMYKAFIEPDLALAHIRIYNTFNPFSGFMDATYILKSAKKTDGSTVEEYLEARGGGFSLFLLLLLLASSCSFLLPPPPALVLLRRSGRTVDPNSQ